MSISSIGNFNNNQYQSLFARLDTSSKGYLNKSDLESAFSKLAPTSTSSSTTSSSTSNTSTSSIDDLFSSLDSDSDGKISKSEFSSSINNLLQSLKSQMMGTSNEMRPPPPPPPNGQGGPGGDSDSGLTLEELQSQLNEIGSSDSNLTSLISSTIDNFDEADTNSDGKVSLQETIAFDQSNSASSSIAATSSIGGAVSPDSSGNSVASKEQEVMRMITQLLQAYNPSNATNSSNNGLSALA